jgi:hypothetical protein
MNCLLEQCTVFELMLVESRTVYVPVQVVNYMLHSEALTA